MHSWIKDDDPNFAMQNPKTGQNFIDLNDLLVNAPDYANWFEKKAGSKYVNFYSTRSCVENNKNKFYCAQKKSEVIF